jgi:hypothetical protein
MKESLAKAATSTSLLAVAFKFVPRSEPPGRATCPNPASLEMRRRELTVCRSRQDYLCRLSGQAWPTLPEHKEAGAPSSCPTRRPLF